MIKELVKSYVEHYTIFKDDEASKKHNKEILIFKHGRIERLQSELEIRKKWYKSGIKKLIISTIMFTSLLWIYMYINSQPSKMICILKIEKYICENSSVNWDGLSKYISLVFPFFVAYLGFKISKEISYNNDLTRLEKELYDLCLEMKVCGDIKPEEIKILEHYSTKMKEINKHSAD